MSQLQSLAIRKKITALFKDGTSKMNLGISATVELLDGVKDMPVTVSGDEPSASDLLRELAAAAKRKITAAPDGLLLTLPVVEPIIEPPAAEPVVTEHVTAPKPRQSRGDIHPSHAPKVERKFKTLSSIFFYGSTKGQINSVYKTRVSNPAKVADYLAALAAGDCNLGTTMLSKSLQAKLIEMGIDPEAE